MPMNLEKPAFPQTLTEHAKTHGIQQWRETERSAGSESRSSEWVEELESAHRHIESAIKQLLDMDRFESASILRRNQKSIYSLIATERSSSTD